MFQCVSNILLCAFSLKFLCLGVQHPLEAGLQCVEFSLDNWQRGSHIVLHIKAVFHAVCNYLEEGPVLQYVGCVKGRLLL